jgi:putative tryptophan/tyrosine transport system substrate-binding protein
VRRRAALTALAAVLCGIDRSAFAQATRRVFRLGLVSGNPRTAPFWIAFFERLRDLGYVEGQNLAVEFLDTGGRVEIWATGPPELIARNVDAVLASGPEIALKSAIEATSRVPIIMIAIDYDPFALGYVDSLARPNRNVTGVFFQQIEVTLKRVELLKQAFPELQNALVFWDGSSSDQWRELASKQSELGLRCIGVELRNYPYDFERALMQAPPEAREFLIVLTSPTLFRDRHRIAEFTYHHRLRSAFALREYVEAGGLLSYGPNISAMYRTAAEYVDRIAQGTTIGDLPIQQPTKFELVLNLKTARALNLAIPPTLLARADEVIE